MQEFVPHIQGHPRPLRWLRHAVVAVLALLVVAGVALSWEYHRYSRAVDRKLNRSALFAARPRVRVVRRTVRPHSVFSLRQSSFQRVTRTVPAYDALPPQLVSAVVAIEDHDFFHHSGVNYGRTVRCAVEDTLRFRAVCGGSTITQQLARVDFLSQRKNLSRKLAEVILARRLEERLTKQQIFAMYAAQINLGQHGPVAIRGFQQAAGAYFGVNLDQLDLAQEAMLAGMIHAPNFDNPYRHPERAMRRRNVVLNSMVETGAITREQAEAAKAEPLHLAEVLTPDASSDMEDSALS